jgi:hypothetical protein
MHRHSLHPEHWQELVDHSGIDREVVSLNFMSLSGNATYQHLLRSHSKSPTNSLGQGWLRRYAQVAAGGWWCSGRDPLADWNLMQWGCYKPNHPRVNEKGKPIKYEHPPGTPTRIFCLRVPFSIWQKVADRYRVPVSENLEITPDGEALKFWPWVLQHKIPLIICEGAKKAAALLSLGYVAIALPGINSGYRVARNKQGRVTHRQLIPDLIALTQSQRPVYLCFDYETKPQTIKAVNHALTQLGELLQAQNCTVKIIRLPGPEKGIDDFILAQGSEAFHRIYKASVDLETDLAQTKPHTELTYPPSLILNCRYLENIPFPSLGLVGIKSAKGTGKTTALTELVQQAKKQKRPVLLLTHRIQLGQFLCNKIGIQWIHSKNLHSETTGSSHFRSLGLCFDSLWKLNLQEWRGAIVILDEVEQSLWHLLNSETCKDKRVKILQKFQQLIANVLQTGGLVIAQDADLSDLSIDYLKGLADTLIDPWILLNEWKSAAGWNITFYDTPNPLPLIQQLEQDLIAGKKCYVTTDSRSGRYSCELIESSIKQHLAQFLKKYPKTLVISSHTTQKTGHEAANFTQIINQKVLDYDALFVTPSLGTGVSIEVEHFDRVYGIFQGVVSDTEVRQALARVRCNIPRVLWCAKRGIGWIGNGSKNYRILSYWYQENDLDNLALLNPLHPLDVDLPYVSNFLHLRTWAKFGARINAAMTFYRQSIIEGLIAEGHALNYQKESSANDHLKALRKAFLATESQCLATRRKLVREIVKTQRELDNYTEQMKGLKIRMKTMRIHLNSQEAKAVATSKAISHKTYEYLLKKSSLTEEESHQVAHYELKQRYGVNVTPQLKLLDDQGYYSQLLLHYALTADFKSLPLPLLFPLMQTVTLFKSLRIQEYLNPNQEFSETDEALHQLTNLTHQYSQKIQQMTGLRLDDKRMNQSLSGIKALSKLLRLLGLKLKRVRFLKNEQGTRIGIYQIDPESWNDGRHEIFTVWQQRDANFLEHSQAYLNSQLENEANWNSTGPLYAAS